MTDQAQAFIRTLRECKAAMRAWTACSTDDLFQVALEAFRAHDKAKAAFLASLANKGGQAPSTPNLTPDGVSQTHCIK